MTMRRLFLGAAALACALLLAFPPPRQHARQAPHVSTPYLMLGAPALAQTVATDYPFPGGAQLPAAALNSAFLHAYNCFYGPSPPAPGGAALAGGCWWNSSIAGQIALEYSADTSGSHWVTIGTLNTSTFTWSFSSGLTLPISDLTGGPLAANLGGTGCSITSGTCLDNITAFSATGILNRTGAGTYAFLTAPAGTIVGTTDSQVLTNKTINCVNNTCTNLPTSGFVNRLRGNSLSQWYSGTSITVTTSGGWASEGVYVLPTGASVTASQVISPASGAPYYALKILGATSNTDVKLRFPIESYSSARLAGGTATFQITYQNNSGVSITPTLATKYPTAQDNYTSSTVDLAATNMQSCANGATCTAAYTLSVNAAANNGYSPTVDFGALGSGAFVDIISFDMRSTPGVTTGLNAAPPTPEIISAALDATWCRRFYQVVGATTDFPGWMATTGAGAGTWTFTQQMRATPTIGFPDATVADYIVQYLATSTPATAVTAPIISSYGAQLQFTTAGVLTAGQGGTLTVTNSATITADARITGS